MMGRYCALGFPAGATYFAPPELLLPPVELPEVPPVPPLVPPVEGSDVPLLVLPLVEPPEELGAGLELDEPEGLLPDMSPPPEVPPVDAPLLGVPLLDVPPVELPLLDVPPVELPLLMLPVSDAPPLVPPGGGVLLAPPLVPPGGGVLLAPPDVPPGGGELVPPEGGVLGAAPGVSDGGGVDDEGVDELGGLVVLLVLPVAAGSLLPPPRLQAATLIVSKPIRIRIFEACILEFIAIPFN